MNAKEEATVTMFRGIEQHLDVNSNIISTISALAAAVAAFKAKIADIISTEQLTSISLSGITVAKSNSKLALSQIAADIAAVIAAYAVATVNTTLEAEVNYSFYKLKRMRDEQLAPACQTIHDRAVEHQSELKDYGISAAKIAELQTAIADYAAKTPNPRTALGSRKTQTAHRRELLRQAEALLKKQIDKLIKNFRITESEFYNTYFNLREIPDAPTTFTQLTGIVTDSADAQPIKAATVEIVELAKIAKTNTAGKYAFKPVKHGEYTVKVTKEDYQPFEKDEIEVKMGDIKHLDVSLVSN
jgi:hypothetical protein